MSARNIVLAWLAAATASTAFAGWTSDVTVTQRDGSACPAWPQPMGWSCILELPPVGFVGVNAFAIGGNETRVVVRLAPQLGVQARWGDGPLQVLDPTTQAVLQSVPVPAQPVRGAVSVAGMSGFRTVGYGPFVEVAFRMNRRVRAAEIRLPPVLADAREWAVPPVRLVDGPRFPVPVPVLPSH